LRRGRAICVKGVCLYARVMTRLKTMIDGLTLQVYLDHYYCEFLTLIYLSVD
jgi:hypothetical protein